MTETKVCKRCDKELPYSAFSIHNGKPVALCKKCHEEYRKELRNNPAPNRKEFVCKNCGKKFYLTLKEEQNRGLSLEFCSLGCKITYNVKKRCGKC